ncbi:hypothetical protein CR513_19352, partial [Mucuna pruriens]
MTRGSTDPLYDLDPQIEKTLRSLRKASTKEVHNTNCFDSVSDNSSPVINTSDFVKYSSTNNFLEAEQMENNDRTLKELVMPQCGEDPYKHLKEFHVVCSTMRLQGIPEDYIKMKAFPFSLDGVAKDWLYLQSILFITWGDMKHMFFEKFFPASKTATIRKEICGIRQHFEETLHEYWERFNKLCATCPHHQISLTMMDKSNIDTTSGGALMDKMPIVARHLISNIATQMVNEIGAVDNLRLEN